MKNFYRISERNYKLKWKGKKTQDFNLFILVGGPQDQGLLLDLYKGITPGGAQRP